MESWLQWVGSVPAEAGQTDGVMEWGDLQPHPQCSSTALQGMRTGVGDLQPLLAQWKGKERDWDKARRQNLGVWSQ